MNYIVNRDAIVDINKTIDIGRMQQVQQSFLDAYHFDMTDKIVSCWDDVVLLVILKQKLEDLIDRVREAHRRAGLSIRMEKIEDNGACKHTETIVITVKGDSLEKVNSFACLNWITLFCRCAYSRY